MYIHRTAVVSVYGKWLFYPKNDVIVAGGNRLGHTTVCALSWNIIMYLPARNYWKFDYTYVSSRSENLWLKQISCDGWWVKKMTGNKVKRSCRRHIYSTTYLYSTHLSCYAYCTYSTYCTYITRSRKQLPTSYFKT